MALIDLIARIAARPAGRVIEAPVRDLVQEALAGSELASPEELAALQEQVSAASEQLLQLGLRTEQLEERLAQALQENNRLQAELHEARSAPKPAPPPKSVQAAPKVRVAPSSTCKVPDCGNKTRSKGFCQKHYRAWRQGELPGFVGPEGRVVHGERQLSVDAEYQGLPVTVTGKKRLTVKVAGTKVPFA